MPRFAASFGECKWTGLPFHSIWPLLGSWMPAMHLISVVLPAPLSPTRAVTWPTGTSRSTPVSACTGPNDLPMPRRLSRGVPLAVVAPGTDGATPALTGVAPSPALFATTVPSRPGRQRSLSSSDSVLGAVRREGTSADLRGRHEVVRDDRRLHVGGGDPFRSQQNRRHWLVALVDVLDCAVHQRRRRGNAGPQVHGQGHGGLRLQVDRLVDRAALVAGHDVLQTGERRVLPGDREGHRLDALALEVVDDGRAVLVVRHEHGVG